MIKRLAVFITTVVAALALSDAGKAANSKASTPPFARFASARADDGGSAQLVANAGYDRHAAIGQTLQLDASASTSLQGQPLIYAWSVVKLPSNSKAKLSNIYAVRPSFTVDVAGDYVFKLTVSQGGGGGRQCSPSQALVTISTVDVAPVAQAGLNRIAAQGSTIALDGSRSFDADGDAIFYAWSLVSAPKGSKASLSSATAARPSLTLDAAGSYVAQLVVTDSTGRISAPAQVTISTGPALPGRAGAGPAQFLPQGAAARVDADGTYLPSGAPTNAAFALLAAPPGSKAQLATGPDSRAGFTLDIAGDYVVETLVSGSASGGDGDGDGDDQAALAATALITTGNVAPKAYAGDDQRIATGARVALDGSRSTDVNGDLLTYSWSLISIPTGSKAALDNAASVQPKFTADVAGDYVAQLIVADAFGNATPSTVVISTQNAKPIVSAGPNVFARTGTAVLLDGSASTDPNGGALEPAWTILGLGDQLDGSLATPNALQTNFNIPVAGVPLTQAVFSGPAAIAEQSYPCRGDDDDNSLRLYSEGRLSNASVPYTIWLISNYGKSSVSATLAAVAGGFSQTLSVPARTDLYVASPVVAGSAAHKLTLSGKIIAQVNALSSTFTSTQLVGGGPPLELSIVQLVASNALLFDYDDAVVSTVETRPLAVPSAGGPAYRGVALALNGVLSQNPNLPTSPTSGLTYSWSLLSRPTGSKSTIVNPTLAIAGITPDTYGIYVAQLIVSDGALASRPKTLVINAAPRAPVAAAAAASSGSGDAA